MKTAQKEQAGDMPIRGGDVTDEWVGDVQMRGVTAGVVPQMSDEQMRERTVAWWHRWTTCMM